MGPESETFWVDIVAFVQKPGLPDAMRQCVMDTVIKENLEWGRDVFLALCIADAAGVKGITDECVLAVRSYFSTASILTPRPNPLLFGASIFGAPVQTGGNGLFGAPAQT